MSRWLAVAVLAAVTGAGCSGGGGPRRLDAKSAAKQIAASLAASTGLPPPDVHCPSGVVVKAGQTFECTMVLDDQPLTVRGDLTDGKGRFTFIPTSAIVVVAKAAAAIQADVERQTGGQSSVECGSRTVLVESPGQTFSCTALAAFVSRKVTVTVADLQGNIRFRLAPPPTGSPPAGSPPSSSPPSVPPTTGSPNATVPGGG